MADLSKAQIDVSIITPVYNGEQWLEECLSSVHRQTFNGSLEFCVYNDASTDQTSHMLEDWNQKLIDKGLTINIVSGSVDNGPKGVGFAKNQAVKASSGDYLCFLDADDVMTPDRVAVMFESAKMQSNNMIIGSGFWREPEGSTERFTMWANHLSPDQLYTQAYTSHGPSVIMPTWLCARQVFDMVGGFDESGKGTPEDLIFFFKHLELGGKLHRVDKPLLMYRYHPAAMTFSVKEDTIWKLRIEALQKNVLNKWPSFTIWNAGKQGRQFYRSITEANREKVVAFCDVDEKKITKGHYTYEDSKKRPKPTVPIIHFSKAKPPLIICMKLDLTGGGFEQNLKSLGLTEGEDYFHFN